MKIEKMDSDEAALVRLWQRVDQGIATDEERADAALLAGRRARPQDRGRLEALLDDDYSEVRKYAMAALVLHFDDISSPMEVRCWKALESDPDEEVRSGAAMCLGKILWTRPSLASFKRMAAHLKESGQPGFVKRAVHDALFSIARRPPNEWPSVARFSPSLREEEVNWCRIALLEDQVKALEDALSLSPPE